MDMFRRSKHAFQDRIQKKTINKSGDHFEIKHFELINMLFVLLFCNHV